MPQPASVALPRPSASYVASLCGVALAIALVPLVYLVLVGFLARGLYVYATYAVWLLLYGWPGLLVYLVPLVAGVLLVAFTLKPFLARLPRPPAPASVDRDQEPQLVAFVEQVCDLLRAPRPARIDIDLGANASAGLAGSPFGRKRLVVSIGLALAATLDAQEFAGVLAHELAHCRQGSALRLTAIVAAMNIWLARVVHERDGWDLWLDRMSGPAADSITGRILLPPAKLAVTVTRGVFRWLVLGSHVASMGLRRHMEHEADRLSALAVGSDVYARTLRRSRALHLTVSRVSAESSRQWQMRRVADDLVACVSLWHGELDASDWREVDEHIAREVGTRFDTHPTTSSRMDRVRALGAPGVLRATGAANALFTDVHDLGRSLTRRQFESSVGPPTDVRAVPAVEFVEGMRTCRERRAAIDSFFGAGCEVTLGRIAPSDEGPPVADTQPALERALDAMARLVPGVPAASARYDRVSHCLMQLLAAQAALALDPALELARFGLENLHARGTRTVSDTIDEAVAAATQEWHELLDGIAPFRRAATDAIAAAARLHADAAVDHDESAREAEADDLMALLNALTGHADEIRHARLRLAAVGFLAGCPPPAPDAFNHALSNLVEQAWKLTAPTIEAVRAVPVPKSDGPVVAGHRAVMGLEVSGCHAFAYLVHLQELYEASLARLLHVLGLVGVPRPIGETASGASPTDAGAGAVVVVPVPIEIAFETALRRRTPRLVATWLLLALSLVTAVVSVPVQVGVETAGALVAPGAAFRPLVAAAEWWRPFTAAFAYNRAVSLGLTFLLLLTFGRTAERVFGTVAFLVYYLLTGAVAALAGVLVSDDGVFATSAAAMLGIGAILGSAALAPVGDTSSHAETPALQFPPSAPAFVSWLLPVIVVMSVRSASAFAINAAALGVGLLLATATARRAAERKPPWGRLAAAAAVTLAVLSAGVLHVRATRDIRSEALAFLATEEQAVAAFAAGVARLEYHGAVGAHGVAGPVDSMLAATARARVQADGLGARFRNDFERRDRFGRVVNVDTWQHAAQQLALHPAYGEYLRSRPVVWRARLRTVTEGRLDDLGAIELAEQSTRAAFRDVLARPEQAVAVAQIGVRGAVQPNAGQWTEAAAAFREQARLAPRHPDAWNSLGEALEPLDRKLEAVEAYRKQLDVAPLHWQARRNLGVLLLSSDPPDYRAAATELGAAERLVPNDGNVVGWLGVALIHAGERVSGLDMVERARRLEPGPWLLSELAYDLVNAGVEIDTAVGWAGDASKDAADRSLRLDIDTARPEEARASWALSWSWHALGWAAFKKGDAAAAARYLIAARSVRCAEPISDHLAQVMEALGDRDDALRFTAEAVMYRDHPALRARLVRLAGSEAAATAAVEFARATVWSERTASFAHVSPGNARTAIVAIFTNGSAHPEVRALSSDAQVEPVLDHVRKAQFQVVFPDRTPARILTDGELVCLARGYECAVMLAFGWPPPPAPR